MSEWKQLIGEWLNEYASLQENEIQSFAAEHEHNHEIATTIFNLFYSGDGSEDSSNNDPEHQLEQVFALYFIFGYFQSVCLNHTLKNKTKLNMFSCECLYISKK